MFGHDQLLRQIYSESCHPSPPPERLVETQSTKELEDKEQLTEGPVLVHLQFDPKLPIRLAGDASSWLFCHMFIQTVLSIQSLILRIVSNPVKRTMHCAGGERSVVIGLGLREFHRYIYGREFTILTDCCPLIAILGYKQVVPPLAATLLQR